MNAQYSAHNLSTTTMASPVSDSTWETWASGWSSSSQGSIENPMESEGSMEGSISDSELESKEEQVRSSCLCSVLFLIYMAT
jgi:hypothetical protein